jgi:Leucine-rich repeat (LRR) protein
VLSNTEEKKAVSSLTKLNTLHLAGCINMTDEVLQTLSSLTALSTLNLTYCHNVSAAAKQALCTAIPNLAIVDQ